MIFTSREWNDSYVYYIQADEQHCYLGDASVYFALKAYRGMLNLKL